MEELLDLLRVEVPREIESRVPMAHARRTERGRCVQATRVGIEVLRYFGFQGRPLVTLMMTGNLAWVEWMLAGQPQPMPDEVWSVGIDPEHRPEDRGYPAHLVIALGGMLLDLDAGLYARPHKGIHLPPTIYTPIRGQEEGKPIAAADLEGGGAVVYHDRSAYHVPPPDFRSIGAWKQTGKWAGPVIRRMRETL
jgi:hypothetical protein